MLREVVVRVAVVAVALLVTVEADLLLHVVMQAGAEVDLLLLLVMVKAAPPAALLLKNSQWKTTRAVLLLPGKRALHLLLVLVLLPKVLMHQFKKQHLLLLRCTALPS
jgi:hypothetical protein